MLYSLHTEKLLQLCGKKMQQCLLQHPDSLAASRTQPSPYGMAMVHLPENTRVDKQTKRLWSNSAFTRDKFGVTSLTSVELFQNCTSVKEGSICFLKMDAIKLDLSHIRAFGNAVVNSCCDLQILR